MTSNAVLTRGFDCVRRAAKSRGDVRCARDVVKKTRAYRPQTNGKTERFTRALLERWAYYEHVAERLAALERLLQSLPSPPLVRRPRAS